MTEQDIEVVEKFIQDSIKLDDAGLMIQDMPNGLIRPHEIPAYLRKLMEWRVLLRKREA